MATQHEITHIVSTPGVLGGKPHIKGHRIGVHHIAWWYSQGESAADLARDYHISLADVHAALAYYYDHKDQIDRELAEEDAEHAFRAAADTSPVAQRMREAIAERKREIATGSDEASANG